MESYSRARHHAQTHRGTYARGYVETPLLKTVVLTNAGYFDKLEKIENLS